MAGEPTAGVPTLQREEGGDLVGRLTTEPPEDPFLRAIWAALPGGGWVPLPHQIPPEGDWLLWLLLAGRGAGKTDACANYVTEHVKGPACDQRLPGGHRLAVIAPTLSDAAEACVNGPSGLKAHNPDARLLQAPGGTIVRWPNGAEAKLFGAHTPEDVERLRAGGNRCMAWLEELAAWRHLDQCWQHLRYGLRLGHRPHAVASTTPRNRPLIRKLLEDSRVVLSRATTQDNPHLDQQVRADLYADYQNTRLGRQELLGELITEVEGALWFWSTLEDSRVTEAPDLQRVVVAIDPAVTSGEESDETGIIAAGLGVDGDCYVLADRTCRLSPDGWARRALALADEHQAERMVAEVNNGGDLVERVIRTVEPRVSYRAVHASRGKRTRAEPVAALYEQQRVHHVGLFPELEEQLTGWTPESGTSPDRLDALVWAVTELMLEPRKAKMRARFVA